LAGVAGGYGGVLGGAIAATGAEKAAAAIGGVRIGILDIVVSTHE